nr:O-antigen ligase family protein [Geotalea sp. SG265]
MQKLVILCFMYINIGRPQDVLEFLKPLSLGWVFGGMTMLFILLASDRGGEEKPPSRPENRLILYILLWMVVTAPFSSHLGHTGRSILELLKTIVLYLGLLLFFRSKEDFRMVGRTLLFSVLTLSISGVFTGITEKRSSVGTFYDPNDLALILIACIPFVTLHMKGQGLSIKIIALLAGVATIIQVVSTQSRMGFLLLILAAFMYAFRERASLITTAKRAVIVGIFGILFLKVVTPEYMLRIQTIFDANSTGSGRTYIWKRAVKMANSRPLTGVGFGAFNSAYGQRLSRGDFEQVEDNKYNVAWKASHNTYLKILVEMGYPALLLYLLLVWRIMKNLKNVKSRFNDAFDMETCNKVNAVEGSLYLYLVGSFFLDQDFSSLFFVLTFLSIFFVRTGETADQENAEQEDNFVLKEAPHASNAIT